jgi:hypothetical protein
MLAGTLLLRLDFKQMEPFRRRPIQTWQCLQCSLITPACRIGCQVMHNSHNVNTWCVVWEIGHSNEPIGRARKKSWAFGMINVVAAAAIKKAALHDTCRF